MVLSWHCGSAVWGTIVFCDGKWCLECYDKWGKFSKNFKFSNMVSELSFEERDDPEFEDYAEFYPEGKDLPEEDDP
ncbi:hypothetical protein RJT34_24520 [Clitoria ternatea]|uniref:Uncharacterized protein n=1 Tax=Clitoria ternatea TaxID=43366 RepID=A0AAN9FN17_CLITE